MSSFYGQTSGPPQETATRPKNALGMVKVKDPSSGQTLYCRHEQKYVKSPVTGATLKISNSKLMHELP